MKKQDITCLGNPTVMLAIEQLSEKHQITKVSTDYVLSSLPLWDKFLIFIGVREVERRVFVTTVGDKEVAMEYHRYNHTAYLVSVVLMEKDNKWKQLM